jgi:hypothetical protein
MGAFISSLNAKVNKYFNGLKGQLKRFVEQVIPSDVILDFFKSSNMYVSHDLERMEDYIR